MKLCSLVTIAGLLAVVSGCANASGDHDEPGAQSAPSTEGPAVSAPPRASGASGGVSSTLAPRDPADLVDGSIYRIKNPESRITIGRHVIVAGPNVRVTASTARGDTVWIQEAGDQGSCEGKTDIVAWRAITVRARAPMAVFVVPGQRIEVEGIVAEENGRRIVADAVITKIDEPILPFEPHCERNGAALSAKALDAVLVKTAGSTESFNLPSNGGWSLAPCFGGEVAIGTQMASYDDWSPSWHWVTGVIDRDGDDVQIKPRDPSDIMGNMHDDVCL